MNALALAAGYVCGWIAHLYPIRVLRIAKARLHLRLINAEINDVTDEFEASMCLGFTKRAIDLANYEVQLQAKKLDLQRRLNRLTQPA